MAADLSHVAQHPKRVLDGRDLGIFVTVRNDLHGHFDDGIAEMLGKDQDQSQDIIPPIPVIGNTYMYLKKSLVIPTLEFMQKVEAYSPFFKHEFWREEAEVRASLLISNASLSKYNISEYPDGTKYYDLEIPTDCIDHIILGPEFDSSSLAEIDRHPEYKFNFREFASQTSLGTGVIRNQ